MPPRRPSVISAVERLARQRRVTRIARQVGFVGSVEYRHAYSQAGGAQYGLAADPQEDLLIVYAEAFDRDSDPDEFTLEAIIAHERGHQLLARHPLLARNIPSTWSGVTEEIVASVIGSLLVETAQEQQDLLMKAAFDANRRGIEPNRAMLMIAELRGILEQIL
jgi:hypothetical protein